MPTEIGAVNSSAEPQVGLERPGINSIMKQLAGSAALRVYLLAGVLCLGILGIYVWLVSVGFWTVWPPPTQNRSPNYYYSLATSFQHGNLALELQPDPALLKLHNPYDPKERSGISFPLDVSLYKGKFYLYWGPVPAAILAIATSISPHQVGDQYLDFAFLAGLLILDAIAVIEIWRRFFPKVPGWIVLFCILWIGLIYPLSLMAFNPAVYEVAIAAGQFFFMGGFVLALTALAGPKPSGWRLALAGLSWACAIGCRTTLAVPVAVASIITMLWLVRGFWQAGETLKAIYPLMALGAPLGLGLLALGWYNWARFGSPFETGLYYQLAGHNLQKNYGVLFSPVYFLQNIYNYFFNPLGFRSAFPFLKTLSGGMQTNNLHWYVLPRIYVAGKNAGMFLITPFLVFAAIPVITTLSGIYKAPPWKRLPEDPLQPAVLQWVRLCLLGASFAGFVLIMGFFSVAARYLADFVPALALLCVMGFWQGYGWLAGRRGWRNLYTLVGILLIVYSVSLSVPLAIADNLQRFYSFNPALLTQIRHSSLDLINALSNAPWLWFLPK